MPIHNADIADIFEQIADILEIENENPFRIRAYRNAALTVRNLGRDLKTMIAEDEDLTRLPSIGKDLAAKIEEICETGTAATLTRLRKQVPPAITELLNIAGLGPKRVSMLYHELDIQSLEQLARACQDGRVHALPGFGEKTEQRILDALKKHIAASPRIKLAVAAQYADTLVSYLERIDGVDKVIVAGSYRRAKETVGDLDILVTAKRGSPVMDQLVRYDEIREVVSKGGTRATVILKSGLQVDIRVVERVAFGAALQYFTGSKAHNIAVRKLGQKRGLKINEYGVFKDKRRIAGETEISVYKAVGLPYIEPELREDHGEIEAARRHLLPKLIEPKDLRGDLHMHSKATDGHNSIREMALAAKAQGLKYIAITEHSQSLRMAHGLDSERLLKQMDEIDALNERLDGIKVLKGIEVEILEDGSLDLPDNVLGHLDLVIGAVHSQFHLTRARQTTRVLRAMEHPHFSILAHPTGRLLEKREPYDVDMLRVIRQARKRGCFLELNAQPQRLDLLDTYCRMAKEEGVLISINSDAHSVMDFVNPPWLAGKRRRNKYT